MKFKGLEVNGWQYHYIVDSGGNPQVLDELRQVAERIQAARAGSGIGDLRNCTTSLQTQDRYRDADYWAQITVLNREAKDIGYHQIGLQIWLLESLAA